MKQDKMPLAEKQRLMHKDLFDKIQVAIENNFYLEAMFLEYSAIEGRLEVMAGVLGLPCNQLLDASIRKDIKISIRIECLKKAYKSKEDIFIRARLSNRFWEDLKAWIVQRNMYMHGLFKNANLYNNRIKEVQELAGQGYQYINVLYQEANRLRTEQRKT